MAAAVAVAAAGARAAGGIRTAHNGAKIRTQTNGDSRCQFEPMLTQALAGSTYDSIALWHMAAQDRDLWRRLVEAFPLQYPP